MKLSLRSIMKPKMAAGGCVGPSCEGCAGPNCMSAAPGPEMLAEGGESKEPEMDSDGDMDGDTDDAMLDACADELLSAIERKDKAQILEAIKAIVLSVG